MTWIVDCLTATIYKALVQYKQCHQPIALTAEYKSTPTYAEWWFMAGTQSDKINDLQLD